MNFEKIQKELDYYQKFTPVNFSDERTKFFESVKKNQPYNPLFQYNDKLDAKRGFQDAAQAGCFQKENSYLLGAIENVKLV